MKEETKLQKVSVELLEVVKKHKLTPTQIRYVFKKVREQGNYQIPKTKKKLPNFLNPAEIYHIKDVIRDKFEVEDIFFFEFLLTTGARIGEFVKIMITDLDFSNNTIKIPLETKTGNRQVPFPQSLQIKCKYHLKGRQRGYLFCKSDQTKYTTRALQIRLKKIIKESKLAKKITPHSLRHTYATILRANKISLQDIQLYLGHSDVKTTQIYAHLVYDYDQQKQIMQIFDK